MTCSANFSVNQQYKICCNVGSPSRIIVLHFCVNISGCIGCKYGRFTLLSLFGWRIFLWKSLKDLIAECRRCSRMESKCRSFHYDLDHYIGQEPQFYQTIFDEWHVRYAKDQPRPLGTAGVMDWMCWKSLDQIPVGPELMAAIEHHYYQVCTNHGTVLYFVTDILIFTKHWA